VRNRFFAVLCVFILVAAGAAAQRESGQPSAAEQRLGTWSGTWDGAGSGGGFELTLERDKDGAIAGKVSVTGEPTYKATLKSIAFEGAKMTGKYDFPPDDAAEVLLAASFEGESAAGTWTLREKSSGNDVASGGWKVTKKTK
jgi:hypothetical protein